MSTTLPSVGASVRVEIFNKKIGIKTEGMSFERSKQFCKSLPGARWDKANTLWTYPLDYRVCTELRKRADAYPAKVHIGPELNEWAKIERDRLASIPDTNNIELVDLPRLRENYPHMWEAVKTRPFQTVGIAIASMAQRLILGDDPGLGKTVQSIGSVVNRFDDGIFLVIAPKSAAAITWPAQLARWVPEDTVINLSQMASIPKARRQAHIDRAFDTVVDSPGRVWVIIGEYWVKVKGHVEGTGANKKFTRLADNSIKMTKNLPELFDLDWDGVLIDESHKVVICNTRNRIKHTQSRFGVDELAVSKQGIKLTLSGTFMRGKSENAWGTLNWLQPHIYTSYWKWMDEHFEGFENEGDPFGPDKVYSGLKDETAFYAAMKDVFLRRTKEEVAADLPPKMYGGEPLDATDESSPHGVWLEMTPGQQKQYQQMVLDGETEDGIIANGILSEWTRLKQFSGAVCRYEGTEVIPTNDSNKLEWLLEFLDDRGILDDSGESKVIVSSQFSKMIDMIESELKDRKVETFKLTGGTKASDRVEMSERFQLPGGPRVFLMTTTAGGVSITLDAADDVVILDETWIPDDQLQVEDRAHRLSRIDHNVTIWYVRSRGSIEEAIAAITGGREAETRGIMDRSRGVNIDKQTKTEISLKMKEMVKK